MVVTICQSNNTDCAAVSTLMKIAEEARQNQGKALLGYLNRSINLMIKAAPGDWTGPLEAITMRHGDCKSYSSLNMRRLERLDSPQTTLGS